MLALQSFIRLLYYSSCSSNHVIIMLLPLDGVRPRSPSSSFPSIMTKECSVCKKIKTRNRSILNCIPSPSNPHHCRAVSLHLSSIITALLRTTSDVPHSTLDGSGLTHRRQPGNVLSRSLVTGTSIARLDSAANVANATVGGKMSVVHRRR